MAEFEGIKWEDVKTGGNLPEPEFIGGELTKEDLANVEWKDVNPVMQSVMDDRDQKVYNMPVAFDGVDATYAIDTQHNGVDKDNFFGKVQVFNESSPSGMLLKKIGDVVRPAMMKLAQSKNKTGSIKRGVYDNAELWADYAWGKMAEFEIGAEQQAQRMKNAGEDISIVNKMTLLGEYANAETEEEAQKIRLEQERELVKELKRFREVTHSYWTEKREQALPEAQMSDVDRAVQQLTNGLMQGGESVATMFVTGNPLAGAALMGAVYGDMKSSDLYQEAITQGKSIDEAEAIGLIGGTIEGGIEMASDVLAAGFAKIAPIRKLTDGVIKQAVLKMAGKPLTQATVNATVKTVSKQLKSVAKEAGKAALTEGGEEFFQGTLGDWWSNVTGLTNISFADSVSEGFMSFLLALPVGGLMGGGGTALYNRMAQKTNNTIKEAVQKANPEATQEQVQQVADGLQEIFFQEAAPQYMKEINNLVEKQVSPDVMPENFTDITTATVKMLKEKFGMTDEEIKHTVQAATNAIDVRNQFAKAYNYFRDELELSGRNPAYADKEARLFAARMVTVARNEGLSVDKILQERGLKVAQMKFADFMAGREAQGKSATISREDIEAMRNLKAKTDKGPKRQSLIAFIKEKGGLKDTGGELKAMDAGKQYIGLINNTSGNGLDDMAQSAWDAGYFEGTERPDINQLLEAIRDELFGNKHYSSKDGWDQALTKEEDLTALKAELEKIGVDVDKDNYGEINRKVKEAERKAEQSREDADYANLSEENQERYAILRDNGLNHYQAMAEVTGTEDEIKFQSGIAEKAVDITSLLDGMKNITVKQAQEKIIQEFEKMLGIPMKTGTPPFKLQLVDGKYLHVVDNGLKMRVSKSKQKLATLSVIEDVVNQAVKTDRPGDVDLSHNKGKTKDRKENTVDEYIYFEAPIMFKDDRGENQYYTVELATEKVKGQDPNLLDLYNVRLKKKVLPMRNAESDSYATGRAPSKDSISQNSDNVNSEKVQFQGGGNIKTPARGAYSKNILYLFENADASTVIHELGHYFLDDLKKYGQSDKAKEQLQAVYDYLGVTDGNITNEQHEYFADSFEVYLKEGKAPNRTLATVFNKFKNWLRQIFREVKRLEGIELNDNIRKTFDEMLGGRSIDFAMQISGQKMAENARSGYISPITANLAIDLLKQGKMSRADMDNILERLRNGEMKRSDVFQELKKFEAGNAQHNEQLNPFDTVKYREALLRDNVSKTKVLEKIETLMKWAQPKEVNGRMVGRFPNKKMNDFFIEVDRLMKLDKEAAKKQIAENKGVITAILQSAPLPETERGSILGMRISDTDRPELLNALAFENRVLSIATKEISVDNAIKLFNDLQDSYNEGRLTANVTGDLKKERKERMIKDALTSIVGIGKTNPRAEKSQIKQALNRFGSSMMSWGGLMDILSMNDSSRTGESNLSKMMDVFEEEQKQAQGVADDGERFCRFFEDKLKGAGNNTISVSKYINNELDKKTTIAWDVYRKTFTKDELIDIYMKAKDKETREIMIKDNLNGYNESFLNIVNQSLTADDRAFADALFNFYDDNWKKINAFYEEKYGITMPKSDFYSPRSMIREGISVTDGAPAYASSGFTKKRTAKVGAVVDIQGAFKVWNNYVTNTNRWLAWSDKLVDINSVFGNTEVKKTIDNLFGENMNKRIRGEVERMAGAGGDKFSAFFSSKLLTKIRGNYARSVLAVKPALMIKQLTSFPAYWNEMSAKDFATGLADFFTHPKEAIELLGNTTLMKTRGTDIIRDFAEISKMDILKGKKGIKWSDAMMLNIKLGDRGAIYMGGWALYKSELKKNLAKGMDEETAKAKALERFEKVTDETQQSGRLSQQSYWQSNPALRMFTMFQSSQNQYLRKEIAAVRGLMTGRMEKGQAVKTLFIFHVLLPCLFQLASDGFDWDKEAQLRAAVLGSLNGVFVLSSLLTKAYDRTINQWLFDTKPQYGSDRLGVREIVPFWASIEDLEKQFEKLAGDDLDLVDIAKAFIDWDEFREGEGGKFLHKTLKAGGELAGLPLKYPLDVIKNFGDYAEEGEYRKELLLYLGWSPYSLREKE